MLSRPATTSCWAWSRSTRISTATRACRRRTSHEAPEGRPAGLGPEDEGLHEHHQRHRPLPRSAGLDGDSGQLSSSMVRYSSRTPGSSLNRLDDTLQQMVADGVLKTTRGSQAHFCTRQAPSISSTSKRRRSDRQPQAVDHIACHQRFAVCGLRKMTRYLWDGQRLAVSG